MRRGSARVALKKLDEAKTDFDDVLFLEPNNKQVCDFTSVKFKLCYFANKWFG